MSQPERSILSYARKQFNGWLTLQLDKERKTPFTAFIVDDGQFGLNFQIARDMREIIRAKRLLLLVLPLGENNWEIKLVPVEERASENYFSTAKRSYLSLVGYIQQARAGKSAGFETDMDLADLSQTAADIYQSLPEGMKREVDAEGLSPTNALPVLTW